MEQKEQHTIPIHYSSPGHTNILLHLQQTSNRKLNSVDNKMTIVGGVLLIVVLSYCRDKRAKSKVIHVKDESCTGCQRCVKKCRYKALETICHEIGRHVVLKYPEKCTACRDCMMVCKFNALELINRK